MLALPVAELPVAGTSLEPFISALYFAFAANDDGPAISSIPAATVNARPARIIACRIAALLSKVPGTRETASDLGLFRPPAPERHAVVNCRPAASRRRSIGSFGRRQKRCDDQHISRHSPEASMRLRTQLLLPGMIPAGLLLAANLCLADGAKPHCMAPRPARSASIRSAITPTISISSSSRRSSWATG